MKAIVLLAMASALLASTPVESGYEHFYNLEYPEASADFEKASAQHPNDPELHNHLAQALVFQETYRIMLGDLLKST